MSGVVTQHNWNREAAYAHGPRAWWRRLGAAVLFVLAGHTWAGEHDVVLGNVWMRETVPGQSSASLQLSLTSNRPATLTGASSPLAERIKMQRFVPHRGRMEAHEVDSLRLPSHRTVVVGESGAALMLVGLKKELNVGDRVPVILTVQLPRQRTLRLEALAEVRRLPLSYRQTYDLPVQDHR
ncbi:MAG: copper chaperone PCu(A)C [Pseudomonadota bacterium]